MKLYEIDDAILQLMDTETGEITDIAAFEALQMEKENKIESLCLWVKDLKAEEKALTDEIENLDSRRKSVANKIESVSAFLENILNGEQFKTSKCSVSYRTSKKVVVEDENAFIEWAEKNADDCLRYSTPTINKTALKERLTNGESIELAKIVENKNISIK